MAVPPQLIAMLVKKLGPQVMGAIASEGIKAVSGAKGAKAKAARAQDLNDILTAMPDYKEPKHGYEGWEELQHGSQTIGNTPVQKYMMTDAAAPALSSTARTIGNVLGAKHSILGAAMQAVATQNKQREGLAGGTSDYINMYGAGKMAKGAVAKAIGEGVGGLIDTLAGNAVAREEKAKQTALLQNEHPVGKYYDAQSVINRKIGN